MATYPVSLPLFRDIRDEDRAALLTCLKTYTRAYQKGEFILLEQDHVQDVGIVLSGTVHMLKEDVWGRRTLLAYMEPGELFGETFALRPGQASHVSFLAAADTKALFLPLDHVLRPCKKQCPFHTTLARNLRTEFRLVATGGFAKWVLKDAGMAFTIDPTLTLHGAGLLAKWKIDGQGR